ncbi:MAG: hypothetical protein ABF802_07960 [Acetobacter orientalis]|uniref:AAA family ATPase n=1 Tax=Acetobacter orientalis TaxID=146474 RepID=UPI0039ED7151
MALEPTTLPNDNADDLPQGSVVAFVQDSITETLISECLQELRPNSGQIFRGSIANAATYLSKNEAPSFLLIDVGDENNALDSLKAITEILPPHVTIMVLGTRADADFYRSVTHVLGAVEYLYRPFSRNLILRILGPIILHGRETQRVMNGASFVACIGTRDGIGASTLVTNLSYFLAETARRYSLLLDFNLRAGKMATLLDVATNGGFRSALEAPDRMDELLLERSMQSVGERLQVLSSMGDLNIFPKIGPNAVQRLMEILRPRFRFILTEVNWNDDVYISVLSQAQQYILILDPSLVSVRDTLRVIANLPRVTPASKPFVIVTNYGRPGSLSKDEITQSLGVKIDAFVPYVPADCGNAEIDGKLVITKNKAYRNAIEQIAQDALAVTINTKKTHSSLLDKLDNHLRNIFSKTKK